MDKLLKIYKNNVDGIGKLKKDYLCRRIVNGGKLKEEKEENEEAFYTKKQRSGSIACT